MKIAGVQKTSFIDYPGKASTVVFFGGCNFRCGYCHNPEIVKAEGTIGREELMAFLKKRTRFLDAVVVSGGEPTLQDGLTDFIMEVKGLGYGVKLDTNGARPDVLKGLLDERLLDYVAMDLKGSLDKYEAIVRAPVDSRLIQESVALLKEAALKDSDGFSFELRTTIAKELFSEEDLLTVCETVSGCPKWFLQKVRGDGAILDRDGIYSPYSDQEMEEMARNAQRKLDEIAAESEREMTRTCVSVR